MNKTEEMKEALKLKTEILPSTKELKNSALLNSCMQQINNNAECLKDFMFVVEISLPHTVPHLQKIKSQWANGRKQIEQTLMQAFQKLDNPEE